jgi:hypothetical protein
MLTMENPLPQLHMARILARGSQERFPEEQVEAHPGRWEAPLHPLDTLGNRIRLAISGALVFFAQRLAGDSGSNPRTT